jgi:hypothetical protein
LNINCVEISRILENHQQEELGSDSIYDDVYAYEISINLCENHHFHRLQEAVAAEGEEEAK